MGLDPTIDIYGDKCVQPVCRTVPCLVWFAIRGRRPQTSTLDFALLHKWGSGKSTGFATMKTWVQSYVIVANRCNLIFNLAPTAPAGLRLLMAKRLRKLARPLLLHIAS